MVIVLEFLLILTAISLLVARGNSKEYKILGVSLLWLALNVLTIIIYISKKGGIEPQMTPFLFFNHEIKRFLQYLSIRLSHLGYVMAIGRTMFPLFILKTALKNNMVPRFRKLIYHEKWFWLPIILTLVAYHPRVFNGLSSWNPQVTMTALRLLDLILLAYVITALVIVTTELFAIQLKIYRQRYVFFSILFFIVSIIYFTSFIQNPIQVYQFYTTEFVWQRGLFSLLSILTVRAYLFLIVVSFIASFIGILALSKYTQIYLRKNQLETKMRKKTNEIIPTITMFIHSIKNQYLANKVLYKRIEKELQNMKLTDKEGVENQAEAGEVASIQHYLDALKDENTSTLGRIDDLYKAIRANVVALKPYPIEEIVVELEQLYYLKYPNGQLNIEMQDTSRLLLDKELFIDAVLNLLVNAQEAIDLADRPDGLIELVIYNVRAFCVLEIKDNGIGIDIGQELQIFEPFNSSKNSKTNWGMGLYFVKSIIASHYGEIECYNNKDTQGATFMLCIPLFKWER